MEIYGSKFFGHIAQPNLSPSGWTVLTTVCHVSAALIASPFGERHGVFIVAFALAHHHPNVSAIVIDPHGLVSRLLQVTAQMNTASVGFRRRGSTHRPVGPRTVPRGQLGQRSSPSHLQPVVAIQQLIDSRTMCRPGTTTDRAK